MKYNKTKKIVPYKSYPASDSEVWNVDEEIVKLRTWAGYDGEDKNTIDWAKYVRAFTYVDEENKESFGAYSFPHHVEENGELKTHSGGTIAAMQRLPQSTLSDEIRKKIHAHLSKHYVNDLNMKPPEFKLLIDEKGKRMENKKYAQLEIKSVDEKKFTVDAIVSNNTLDADREVILNSAWKNFTRYKSNPVLLANHGTYDLDNVIGRCKSVHKTRDGVECKFEYFVGEGNEKADWAFALAKKKIAAYSVGFLAHKVVWEPEEMKEILKSENITIPKDRKVFGVISDAELYEVSQVTVGANKDALMKSKGIADDVKKNITDSYDEIVKYIKSIYDKIEIEKDIDTEDKDIDTEDKDIDTEDKDIDTEDKDIDTEDTKINVTVDMDFIIKTIIENVVENIKPEIENTIDEKFKIITDHYIEIKNSINEKTVYERKESDQYAGILNAIKGFDVK